MAEKMDPPFSAGAAKCRKCEGTEIGSMWLEAKTGDEPKAERIQRICGRCSYSWYERPADAGTGPGG